MSPNLAPLLAAVLPVISKEKPPPNTEDPLLTVKRIYIDELTGGAAATQMRSLLSAALQGSKLFKITEDEDKADAVLRGAASDDIFDDSFHSTDSINAHVSSGSSSSSSGI